jgi:hypothetical protein
MWSYEEPTFHHGVFTQFLLDGLEHPDADGWITFNEVSRYVRDAMDSYSKQHRREQHPFEAGDYSGDDFYIAGESKRAVGGGVQEPSPFFTVRQTVEVSDLTSGGSRCSLQPRDVVLPLPASGSEAAATVRVFRADRASCRSDAIVSVRLSDLDRIRSLDQIPPAVSDQLGQPQAVSPPSNPADFPPALDDPKRIFVVSSAIEGAANGHSCSLTEGDVVQRTAGKASVGGKISTNVVSSKERDCPVGAEVLVSAAELQEMSNQFREQIDSGLKELLASQSSAADAAEAEAAGKHAPAEQISVVPGHLVARGPGGKACTLSPGSIVARSEATAPSEKTVKVRVVSSKAGDCPADAIVSVPLADLPNVPGGQSPPPEQR